MKWIRVITRWLALVLATITGLATAAPAADPVLCSLRDDRISESSGVAVSGDVIFTHNDSGDSARFFALDRSCRTLATYSLSGVDASDWEDMARGAGALWFGDIGDNAMQRTEVVVHRVAEPRIRPAVQAVRSTAYRFRYADGAHDAETLLVHPRTGQLFVVTKSYAGMAGVYAAPVQPSTTAVNVLTEVGSFRVLPSGTAGGPIGPAGQLTTTGGDISPRADRVVVRTYTDAYEWTVARGDVAAAFAGTPTRTALPATTQGEAIGYDRDGRSWITTTEGVRSAVHRLAR